MFVDQIAAVDYKNEVGFCVGHEFWGLKKHFFT